MQEILPQLSPEDQEWLQAMMGYLLDTELEAEYCRAVLNGNFPSSEHILKQALHEIYVRRASNVPVVREA